MAKGRPWMIVRRGTEFNSYHCVLAPLLDDVVVRLLHRTPAPSSLNWSSVDRAGRVGRLRRPLARVRRTVRARAVVVAAGAIDSTALLLRSRSADFPDGLGNTRGLVGALPPRPPPEWWPATTARPMPALVAPGPTSPGRDGTPSAPLMATSLTIGLRSPLQRLRTFYGGSPSAFGVQVFGTMVPTPDVGVRSIATSRRPAALRPRSRCATTTPRVANIESARQRLRDVLGAAALDATVPGPFHALHPGSSVHYGGSVRMHADPEFGVLDGWNRMHDVPTSPSSTAAASRPDRRRTRR